ncbi:MAG: 6-phosphogluconolactonase [Opitutales bacterium]
MMHENASSLLSFDGLTAGVYPDPAALGVAAAEAAVATLENVLANKPRARLMIGTGNSQESTIGALVRHPALDWSRIEVFHMDEYVGLSPDHPASFRRWLRTRVEETARPAALHYLAGDAPDLAAEIERYTQLLLAAPLDLSFIGFGENGHIAFNDPHVADFEDPATLKRVVLDEACRRQQVGEGHFDSLEAVPTEALTVTCPGLFRARRWIAVVPEKRKAEAVRAALTGPVTPACPGSLIRRHANVDLFLDEASASLLPRAQP